MPTPDPHPELVVEHLGRMPYAEAYVAQSDRVTRVLAAREAAAPRPFAGFLLLVEHDPVVTVSNRPSAMANLVATPEMLARQGVALERTDRGGDITYHGPGQIVVYPILDLNLLNLGLHDYMRLLEQAVIDTCADWNIPTQREPGATGVWVPAGPIHPTASAKIAAMGVRVRRWVSMHGLALNVETNLDHFRLIVPCGLVGRDVTSMRRELGDATPSLDRVERALVDHLRKAIALAHKSAIEKRRNAASS
ncbi:MAG: octanoyltransferase [Phycisphaerae bacterium]|nr:MAG: octanoyltransferase [Phycisphaerae bacterium]